MESFEKRVFRRKRPLERAVQNRTKMTLWRLILCLLLALPLQRGFQFQDLPYEQVLKRSLALEGRFAEVKSAVQLWGESFRLREVSH